MDSPTARIRDPSGSVSGRLFHGSPTAAPRPGRDPRFTASEAERLVVARGLAALSNCRFSQWRVFSERKVSRHNTPKSRAPKTLTSLVVFTNGCASCHKLLMRGFAPWDELLIDHSRFILSSLEDNSVRNRIAQWSRRAHMQPRTGLAFILSFLMLVAASCNGGDDANRATKANELQGSLAGPIDRGAPGNPRGPTDPSR